LDSCAYARLGRQHRAARKRASYRDHRWLSNNCRRFVKPGLCRYSGNAHLGHAEPCAPVGATPCGCPGSPCPTPDSLQRGGQARGPAPTGIREAHPCQDVFTHTHTHTHTRVSVQSFGHHCFGPWTATGGSVKSEGLGDGSTPEARVAPHAADKSPIAKLPLDAATRMPGCFHTHTHTHAAESRRAGKKTKLRRGASDDLCKVARVWARAEHKPNGDNRLRNMLSSARYGSNVGTGGGFDWMIGQWASTTDDGQDSVGARGLVRRSVWHLESGPLLEHDRFVSGKKGSS